MVAGAVKIYSWKNENTAGKAVSDILILKIREKKRFTIKSLEKCLGYDREKSYSENHLTSSKAERLSNQAYYYLAKFLKEKYIRKTDRYETQGGTKPLMIYELVK